MGILISLVRLMYSSKPLIVKSALKSPRDQKVLIINSFIQFLYSSTFSSTVVSLTYLFNQLSLTMDNRAQPSTIIVDC